MGGKKPKVYRAAVSQNVTADSYICYSISYISRWSFSLKEVTKENCSQEAVGGITNAEAYTYHRYIMSTQEDK